MPAAPDMVGSAPAPRALVARAAVAKHIDQTLSSQLHDPIGAVSSASCSPAVSNDAVRPSIEAPKRTLISPSDIASSEGGKRSALYSVGRCADVHEARVDADLAGDARLVVDPRHLRDTENRVNDADGTP